MSEATRLHLQGGAVRLTLPARVANDLEGLQRTLGELAERMGHPSCATGCDTLFLQLEREFSATSGGDLNPQPLPPEHATIAALLPQDPVPLRTVEVIVPDRVSSNIDSLRKAVAVTVGKLGCGACCSGFDIVFRRELDLIAIDENLEVQGFGRLR
jgi:hypothetical protein